MVTYAQDIRLLKILYRLMMGLVGFTLAASSMGLGQTCQTISVGDNDGLVKSPQNYRVLYETDDVRVLEATIPPHEAQSLHSFTRPAILYVQTSIDSKTISPGVDDPIEHLEDKSFRPTVIRINAPGSYATTNLSNHAFHGVRVEFKHPGCRLTSAKSSNSPAPATEGEGVAMQSNGFHKLYEDGDARVSELNTQLHSLAVLQSTWPGFYYVVTTGSSVKAGRLASVFAIGAAAPQDLSLRPGANIHVIRFELKQASH